MEHALAELSPGQVQPSLVWDASGRVLFCVALTKSVMQFALSTSEGTVDCLARVQDGWPAADLDGLGAALREAALEGTDSPVIHAEVSGFPERLPAEQGASVCLHLQRLRLGRQTWQVAEWVRSAEPAPPRALSVNRKSNEARFPAFAAFLLEVFGGHSGLSAGQGVLDVAGGSGGLAFELAVRRQVPCCVVDPRTMRLTSTQRLVLDHRRSMCALLSPWTSVSPLAASTNDKFQQREIKQIRTLFDSGAVLGSRQSSGRGGACGSCSKVPVGPAGDATASDGDAGDDLEGDGGGSGGEGGAYGNGAGEGGADGAGACELGDTDARALWDAARECSVLVGLHPDNALDSILDVALALRKPVAVVPCCVFWKHGCAACCALYP